MFSQNTRVKVGSESRLRFDPVLTKTYSQSKEK